MCVLMSVAEISWVERVAHVGRALLGTPLKSLFGMKVGVQFGILFDFRGLVSGFDQLFDLLVSVQPPKLMTAVAVQC